MTSKASFPTPILFFRYLFFACIYFHFSIIQSHFLFANSGVIHISAAVSTKEALTEIQSSFAAKSEAKVVFNYGASGALVTQVLAGAPCDLVLSADYQVLDRLVKAEQLSAERISPLLGNSLVIAIPANRNSTISSPEDLQKDSIRKIALGKPDIVPAGTYAQLWLKKLNLWNTLHAKMVFTPHVRAAVTALSVGNVDAALVYKTDVLNNALYQTVYEFPHQEEPKILYPLAIMNSGAEKPEVQAFVEHLKSPEAQGIFEKHGFTFQKP